MTFRTLVTDTLADSGLAILRAAKDVDLDYRPGLKGADLLRAVAESDALITRSGTMVRTPAETMRLLNRHLYRSTPPEKYATLFLALYDGVTRTLSYTNAGHLPPIVIRRNGTVEALEVSGTVIGLFEDMVWQQSTLQFSP